MYSIVGDRRRRGGTATGKVSESERYGETDSLPRAGRAGIM